ncbi:AGR250Cp [Eremothecium gossypii ATCC 10895]|uniref:AGR250Cp n=1 Tax=Eremothecium gossypii (strain ATCC 10895 / CBS 109.51 / FGSC 9923 / NRRL Y-1056) TaxID=284811 RepID=Q74ZE9_EREGS|nr:AGR250Cp [Eremothecium gossypii ATCC 10895]AAS54740.2 AGR250Cp [Eremothecium gossypii ATCC 10895]AEY99071.1 FAGR250Cp [Eremothecium gossypii FDAG1]
MLVLEEYTDRELADYTHSHNSNTWKTDCLTVEQYVARENLLAESYAAKPSKLADVKQRFPAYQELLGLKYFVLKDTSLPSTDKYSQIVSSCETLNRVGWCIPGESSDDAVPILTICVGVVYTLPTHRGKGYAKEMVTRVNRHYDSMAQKLEDTFVKNKVMFLYSEVGEYYSQVGYVSAYVPLHRIGNMDGFLQQYCKQPVQPVRALGFSDYEDLVELQRQHFQTQLRKLHQEHGESFVFTVEPSLAMYQWFQLRDQFMATATSRPEPSRFGAALSNGSHVIWHHNWADSTLLILKAHLAGDSRAEDDLKQLLREAVLEAEAANLAKVEFWDQEIDPDCCPELYAWLKVHEPKNMHVENGSLSAMRLPQGVDPAKVIWANNTKFSWF